MGQSTPLQPGKRFRDEVDRLMAHNPPAQYGEIAGDDDPDRRDYVARGLAREALANISAHERLCEERDADAKERWDDASRVQSERHQNLIALVTAVEVRTVASFSELKQHLTANQNSETSFRASVNSRFLLMYGSVIATLLMAVAFLSSKLLFH
jgi:hypothetical protein